MEKGGKRSSLARSLPVQRGKLINSANGDNARRETVRAPQGDAMKLLMIYMVRAEPCHFRGSVSRENSGII